MLIKKNKKKRTDAAYAAVFSVFIRDTPERIKNRNAEKACHEVLLSSYKCIVTKNNFECLRYDCLLYFNMYVTDLLLLPPFLI